MISGVRPGSGEAVGWHGKLPALGDFASRRLNSDFIRVWDHWISTGMAKFRSNDERAWVADYLASPTWRFLLTPGFLPSPLQSQTWVGVLMPSVDRVGRYYPMTLATPLSAKPVDTGEQRALWKWLQNLEDVAVGALHGDWSIDFFEQELVRLGLPLFGINNRIKGDSGLPEDSRISEHLVQPSWPDAFFSTHSACMPSGERSGVCVWFSCADSSFPELVFSQSQDESILDLWRGHS